MKKAPSASDILMTVTEMPGICHANNNNTHMLNKCQFAYDTINTILIATCIWWVF